MTVYLDVILIENLCMNYIILFATGYVMKIKMKHIRLLLSALLGGIYAIMGYMQILEIYSNTIMKMILSIVMVYIAYQAKNVKILGKQIIIFYLTSFVFGGCAFALLYFVRPQDILMKDGVYIGTYPIKIAILGGIVGFTIITIAFRVVKSKLSKKDMFCKIKIYFNEKQIETIAIIDTGNMLKDPITRMPVIVVEKDILYDMVPHRILENLDKIIGGDVAQELYQDENMTYLSKFRVIPFSSIGKQNGLLLGFKANKVEIEIQENEESIQNVIIGIYDKPLNKKSQYHALLGLDIIERSEEDEYIANVSQ